MNDHHHSKANPDLPADDPDLPTDDEILASLVIPWPCCYA